jgi:uncharacterized membrane protein (UPF0127 family)
VQAGTLLDAVSGDVIVPHVERTTTLVERVRGLLGQSGLAADSGLLIDPCPSVHTAFMGFAIDVVYLDEAGAVVKVVPRLAPWRLSAARGARMTLELAAGSAARCGLAVGRRVRWRGLA